MGSDYDFSGFDPEAQANPEVPVDSPEGEEGSSEGAGAGEGEGSGEGEGEGEAAKPDAAAAGDSEPKFKTIDGREVTREQYEYENGLLYADYTRKAQRLADLERVQQEATAKPNPEPDKPTDRFVPDPLKTPEENRAQEVIFELSKRAGEKAAKELQPQLEALKAELAQQIADRKEREAADANKAQTEATLKEIGDLKVKYPDFEEEKVMQFGLANQVYSLEAAYKLMTADQREAAAAKKAADKTKYDMSQKRPAGVVPGASDAQAPTGLKPYNPDTDKGKSFSDLLREGFSELKS